MDRASASSPERAREAALRAARHLVCRQRSDGAFEGEMVWNTMILAQVIIARHVVGRGLSRTDSASALRHFDLCQGDDGGFGLHAESAGFVFFTALAYVAMRLLGRAADDEPCARARAFLRRHDVRALPSWGKQWMAMLGLYGWEGVPPCPPELFALPRRLPIHPSGWYCHTRHIYAALAYLYGRRFTADLGPLRDALRAELYDAPFETVDFAAHLHDVAPSDLYVPRSAPIRVLDRALLHYERRAVPSLRRRALTRALAELEAMLRESRDEGLSPVSGVLSLLALHAADPAHPRLGAAVAALERWRFHDGEGLRYAGARSQTWDTAFAAQALTALPDACEHAEALRRAHAYLAGAQMGPDDEAARETDREGILGGFCFSDGSHRWPVSDCTAEAVSALLGVEAALARAGVPAPTWPDARLAEALDFLYARQNEDGGFGSYERRRGPLWLDRVNPSEMFGACMIERSYVECTASCVDAFAASRRERPAHDGPRLRRAMAGAVDFLRRAQHESGGWRGFWGVHFTYGTFHAVRGLRAAGVPEGDPALCRAADFLRRIQREDGAFGERWEGCMDGRYTPHERGQPVQTAWALLTLEALGLSSSPEARRATAWLLQAQRDDGGFDEGAVNGVFFGSAMLTYRLYSAYFPLWALARLER